MPTRRRARKTTRRSGVRRRLSRASKSRGTKILGRSAKNLATGAILYEGVTRIAPTQSLGTMQMPANMILTGAAGELFGGGQKDFISVGSKVGIKRLMDRYLLPRIFGGNGNGTATTARAQGGY